VTRGQYFGEGAVIGRQWDVSPDVKRFLMLQSEQAGDGLRPSIRLVHNWLEVLKQRVPAR
jgi:hypothetical protein